MNFAPRPFARAAVLTAALFAAGCGGGYDDGPAVAVGVGVSVPVGDSAPVAGLGLQLTRIGPETVQLDWSYDSYAAYYDVSRDGYALASVASTTLIDASGIIGAQYCYQVVGRDSRGRAVSTSSVGCITLF